MEEQGIILSPKEKAKELFDKMYNQTQPDELGKDYNSAKECALIAVDEIIDALDKSLIDSDIEWWQEVKQEIKKL
jgi:hypothetical protein